MDSGFSSTAGDIIPDEAHDHDMELQQQESPTNGLSSEVPSPSDFNVPPPIPSVERIWFTTIREDDHQPSNSSPMTAQAIPPVTQHSELTDVDDQYRLQLSKAILTPQLSDDPLPSSDFLVHRIMSSYSKAVLTKSEFMRANVLYSLQSYFSYPT